MSRYYSRKFALAAAGSAASIALCWYGKLSGTEWVTVQSIILGLYKAANVLDSKGAK